MYRTDYFIRFVNSPEHAQCDLERGYSFSSYAAFEAKDEAVEFWADLLQVSLDDRGEFDPEADPEAAEELSDRIGYQAGWGYGLKLDGLCGFGPFETAEEAEEQALARRGYNGVEWPAAAIYTGRHIGQADCGDGDMFVPTQLVKVIEIDY